MRARYVLTPTAPSISVNLPFEASNIVINNPTGSVVFLRQGGNDIPNIQNYDYLLPAASISTHPVIGDVFAVAMDNPQTLSTSLETLGALSDTVIVEFLDDREAVPTMGAISFVSLSLTDILTGIKSYDAFGSTAQNTYGPIDLASWGGLVGFVRQDVNTTQGILVCEQSDSKTGTWIEVFRYPLWADVPVIFQIPRTTRWARIRILATPLGNAPVTGKLALRASIQEIQAIQASALAVATTAVLTANPSATANMVVYTAGLKAIQFATRYNIYSVGSQQTIRIYTGPTSLGPWYTVLADTFAPITQPSYLASLSFLQQYAMIEVANTGPDAITFEVTPSILNDPDPTSPVYGTNRRLDTALTTLTNQLANLTALNTITGTPSDAIDAGTVFGQLRQIRTMTSSYLSTLGPTTDASGAASIFGKLRGILDVSGTTADAVDAATMYGQLRQIRTMLTNYLATLGATTDASGAASIFGKLRGILDVSGTTADAANSSTLFGKLKQVVSTLGLPTDTETTASAYGLLLRALSGLGVNPNNAVTVNVADFTIPLASSGALYNTGTDLVGTRLLTAHVSTSGPACKIGFGWGSSAAFGNWFWEGYVPANADVMLDLKGAGLVASFKRLWAYNNSGAAFPMLINAYTVL